jgi:hypothetical protein
MPYSTPPEAIKADRTSRPAIEAELRAAGSIQRGSNWRCPFHDDTSPSGGIYADDAGVFRFKCHAAACGFHGDILDIRAKISGVTVKEQFQQARAGDKPRPSTPPAPPAPPPQDDGPTFPTLDALLATYRNTESVYKYTSPDTGRIDLVVIRYQRWDREKDCTAKAFAQCHQRADGLWVQKKPPGLMPIYNRTRLRDAELCLVVEGEQCVHSLADVGVVATTSPGGAGKARYADWSPLRGKRVYLWPDNDAANATTGKSGGHEHMREVAEILKGLDCDLHLVDPDAVGLDRDGSDVVDFLACIDGTANQKRDAIDDVLAKAKPLTAVADLFDRLQECIDGRYRDVGFAWPTINRFTQSLLPGAIVVLCGAPGSTKSYMLLESLMHWQSTGVGVACYMLEHDRPYWLQRCLAMFSGIAGLVNASWVANHPIEAMQAAEAHRRPLEAIARIIDTSPAKPASHAELLKWMDTRSAAGCRILCIDPITAAEPTEKPWIADLNFIMAGKKMARERGFSLLLVTHPRVMGKRNSPLDDLAGGAAFQRFTQTVLVLKSHSPPREVEYLGSCGRSGGRINRSLIVAKATNGPGGGMEIGMNFDGETLRLTERGLILGDKREE